jgi:hypothetical protein
VKESNVSGRFLAARMGTAVVARPDAPPATRATTTWSSLSEGPPLSESVPCVLYVTYTSPFDSSIARLPGHW